MDSSSTISGFGFDIPIGYRFDPTDRQIVSHYLPNLVIRANQNSSFIKCDDLSGETEPWTIWERYYPYASQFQAKDSILFLTQRLRIKKKNGQDGKHFNRKAGTGTWSGEQLKPILGKNGDTIGFRGRFRYEGGCDPTQNGAWFMHEYDITKDDIQVICKLWKSPKIEDDVTNKNAVTTLVNKDNENSKKKRKINDQVAAPVVEMIAVDDEESSKRQKLQVNNELSIDDLAAGWYDELMQPECLSMITQELQQHYEASSSSTLSLVNFETPQCYWPTIEPSNNNNLSAINNNNLNNNMCCEEPDWLEEYLIGSVAAC